MDAIARILHGSYAYLLIFEILLVAGLSLIALSLLVRRIKGRSQPEETAPGVSLDEVNTLREQIRSLETTKAELEKAKSEAPDAPETDAKLVEVNRTLTDKVKYLEAKLLEYEILQEEIGSLSTLKVENEKLRETLVALQKAQAEEPGTLEEPVAGDAEAGPKP
ncbi:MAG: hypothetical protein HYZ71_04670 [Deltaproteobacteria bacterium]|nr:hypothetical protein [Deltaproteobacteria bacterium]